MSNPYEDKIHDWWWDSEFNTHFTLIEKLNGELHLIISPKPKEEPKDAI